MSKAVEKYCKTCRFFRPDDYGTFCTNPGLAKFHKIWGTSPISIHDAIETCDLKFWEAPETLFQKIRSWLV